jgi:hypothetical protein
MGGSILTSVDSTNFISKSYFDYQGLVNEIAVKKIKFQKKSTRKLGSIKLSFDQK